MRVFAPLVNALDLAREAEDEARQDDAHHQLE